MSAFMLAKRRKRGGFSFGSQTLAAMPAENITSGDPSHKNHQGANKHTPFSNDCSDDDDDGTTTKKHARVGRLVTSVSSVPEGVITLSSNEKPPSSRTQARAPKSGTSITDSVIQHRQQNSASRPSQIGRMLEKRREATRMMTQSLNPSSQLSTSSLAYEKPLSEISSEKKSSQGRGHDDALFRVQLEQCAENARVDAYNATPVSGFGEAMLRAMGWNGSSSELATSSANNAGSLSSSDLPKPRPDRLGLGAKLTSGATLPPSRKRKRVVLPNTHTNNNGKPPRPPATPSRDIGASHTDDSSNFGASQTRLLDTQDAQDQHRNSTIALQTKSSDEGVKFWLAPTVGKDLTK